MPLFNKKAYLPASDLISGNKTTKQISFCITHKNRFDSLKKTLIQNLNDNITNRINVEFILMDFDKTEDVKCWIVQNFQDALQDGYLKYFHCDQLEEWHASKGKNTSHIVGTGSVLVNLDCDNYTGKNGGTFVYEHFTKAKNNIVLWQWSKIKKDGSFGRIALTQDLFKALGGYDELFLPMGYQDNDLIARAKAKGAQLIHNPDKRFNKTIINDKYQPTNMSYHKMKMLNKSISKFNLAEGILTANEGNIGLRPIFEMNNSGTLSAKLT